MTEEGAPGGRTVCHGCRQVTQFRTEESVIRPMILPGNGTVWVEKMPGGMVEVACPVCGEDGDETGDEAGWVAGFVPPV